jgi:hypothetical protein
MATKRKKRTRSAPVRTGLRVRPEHARRGRDGKFEHRALPHWARMLRIPYNRLYFACTALGLQEVATDDDVLRIIQYLQARHGAAFFTTLGDLFGENTTLAQLSMLESIP